MKHPRYLIAGLALVALGLGTTSVAVASTGSQPATPETTTSTTVPASSPTLPVGTPETSAPVPVEIAPGTTVERPVCPTDGTAYGFGTCVVPDGVLPAPSTFDVEPDAPSQICTGPDGVQFECPAGYVPPTYDDPEPEREPEPEPVDVPAAPDCTAHGDPFAVECGSSLGADGEVSR